MTTTTTTNNARAIAHHTNKTVEAIEMANNAYLISNAGGVVVFAASYFAAGGIARAAKQTAKALGDNTFAIIVKVPRAGVTKGEVIA